MKTYKFVLFALVHAAMQSSLDPAGEGPLLAESVGEEWGTETNRDVEDCAAETSVAELGGPRGARERSGAWPHAQALTEAHPAYKGKRSRVTNVPWETAYKSYTPNLWTSAIVYANSNGNRLDEADQQQIFVDNNRATWAKTGMRFAHDDPPSRDTVFHPSTLEPPMLFFTEAELQGFSKAVSIPPHHKQSRYQNVPITPGAPYPKNKHGRTGLLGRGLLGKFGPNHAADPVVTYDDGNVVHMILIEREDTGQNAIPGGMLDPAEKGVSAAIRELFEEVGFEIDANHVPANVYEGYVDDPRNTDMAWMETRVYHWHLTAAQAKNGKLTAGDDARKAHWVPVQKLDGTRLISAEGFYASHYDFIDRALRQFTAKREKARPVWERVQKSTKSSQAPRTVGYGLDEFVTGLRQK